MRSSYYAFGSLTGTDLIYGVNVAGGLTNNTLPMVGNEAAVADGGASSGFHLYPGAEVVNNTDQHFACTLEQNGVAWANGDLVENPHYPIWGGQTLWITRTQQTPNASSTGMGGFHLDLNGTGIGGGVTAIQVRSNNPSTMYAADSGPLAAPAGIELLGFYSDGLFMSNAPQSGAAVYIQNPAAPINNPNALVQVVVIDFNAGGNLFFRPATGDWRFDGSVDAPGFSQNGSAGATGTVTLFGPSTNGSLTLKGGIITAFTNPT
jgi:hypothetical protein